MKKKIILSSILLLALLLGFCSISFANYNITTDNINELFEHYSNVTWYNRTNKNTVKNNALTLLNNNQNNYDNTIVYLYSTSNGQFSMYYYFFNNNDITSATYTNEKNFSFQGANIKRISVVSNTSDTQTKINHDSRGQYFMIRNNVGNLTSTPFQNINVMTFIPTSYFEYIYNDELSDIYIDEDFPSIKQLQKYYNFYIAEFGQTTYFDSATLTYWKYEKERGYFEPVYTKDVSSYTIINNDLGELYLNSSDFIGNTIMTYTLRSNDLEQFSSLGVSFYAVDSNTFISSGDLDIDNTFNDTYYEKYTNIINNLLNENKGNITNPSGDITGSVDFTPITNGINDINNTLTDDSQVDNIISSNLSGDYESIAEDIGYQVWENPFFTFLLNIFEDFYDALTKREDINIDLSFHGVPLILNTRDFITPNGIIKDLIKWCMIFFYVYFNYKYFNHLISLLQTFKLNTLIAKLGTDEFYDSDYM